MTRLVLDTGALIALERKNRLLTTVLAQARVRQARVIVPPGCLAQAWRDDPRQARLATLLRQRSTLVEPLDRPAARAVGALLARAGFADIVDAHVALLAAGTGATVLTSDPEDIGHLAPSVEIIKV